MGFLTHYLKEMLVVGDKSNTHVIAFDKWIYLLNGSARRREDDHPEKVPIRYSIGTHRRMIKQVKPAPCSP